MTTRSPEARLEAAPCLCDMIAVHADTRPDARAVVCGERAVTWRELHARIERIAAALAALGVGRGDAVAMLAATTLDYLEMFLGTLRAGACAVPLSSMSTPDALRLMVEDSQAKVLCVSDSMRSLAEPFQDALPQLVDGGRIAFDFAAPGWTEFGGWIDGASATAPDVTVEPGDRFNIIYSSGTTGTPKGIVHSHRMRMQSYVWGMKAFGYRPDAVSIVSTPLYSNTTLTGLLPALGHGGCSVLMRKFDVAEFLALSQSERATHAMLVPVQYQRLMAYPEFDTFDLTSYEMKLSTSAPMRPDVKRDVLDRWPGGLVEIYGMTEGGVVCILQAHVYPDKLHTVGRPTPGSDMRIIDEEGREVPVGVVGEVVGRAQNMMDGYHRREEQTADGYWYDDAGRRYQRSGDMGRFDADGFLELLDRKKDMIISGGFNIYAADLEAVLLRHEDVDDVAVVAVPSDRWGETPLGFVVLHAGAAASGAEVRQWANARLGKGQRLSAVEVIAEIPRSDIGKVMKKELRAPYWQGRDSGVA